MSRGPGEQKWDFFISRRGCDAEWAKWIDCVLREAGFSTIVQDFDFVAGSNIVGLMQAAATQAERTIAVLSNEYLASAYTNAEWFQRFFRDPDGSNRLLIPVRVQECRPAGFLEPIVYCDLVGLEENEAARKLTDHVRAAISGSSLRPAHRVPFPAPVSAASRAPFPPKIVNRTLGLAQHRPFRAINFTGRQTELDELAQTVREKLADGAAFGLWGLTGTGGIGKSALAAELAERLYQEPHQFPGGVLWTNLLEEQPHEAALGWLVELGVSTADIDPAKAIARFHQLAAKCRPLIVLDNAQSRDQVERLLVKAPGVGCLITTREADNIPAGIPSRGIDVLHPDDALQLLRSITATRVDNEPDSARTVCAQCGHFPLFLRIAGEAVSYYESLSEYAAELRARGLAGLAEHDALASTIFDISYEKLSPAQADLFGMLSQFPGASFGVNFVARWLNVDTRTARQRLIDLERRSLLIRLREDEQTSSTFRFRFHDRVRDYAASRLEDRQAEVRLRMLEVWCDWEFMESELQQVGAYELSGQYHQLGNWREAEMSAVFPVWSYFVRGQTHVLAEHPELFFQQAINEAVDSPVSQAAQERTRRGLAPERWLEWTNRPQEYAPPASLRVLQGHTSSVTSVSFSPDARRALSGAYDKTLRLWDVETGESLRVLEGHTGTVWSVSFSPDGRRALSGSSDDTLRLWDVATGESRRVLEGHTGRVTSVSFSPDGRRALSGSHDNTLRLWDVETEECLAVHPIDSDEARAVAGAFATSLVEKNHSGHWLVLRDRLGIVECARFPGDFSASDCSADRRTVVAGTGSGDVYFLRFRTRSEFASPT